MNCHKNHCKDPGENCLNFRCMFSHQILIQDPGCSRVHSGRSLTGMCKRCPWSAALCAVLASDWLTYSHAAFWLAGNSYSSHGKFDFCVTFSVVMYLLLILWEYLEFSQVWKHIIHISEYYESRTIRMKFDITALEVV